MEKQISFTVEDYREEIILAAIQIASSKSFKSKSDLEVAIAKASIFVKSMLDEKSLPSRVLGSIQIQAEVLKVEFEEQSQRYKVYYRPLYSSFENQEVEHVRTDRVDGYGGSKVHAMVANIVGKQVTIYKTSEETGNPMKPSVRIAPLIIVKGE